MQSGQPTPALEGKALRTVSLSAHVQKRVRVLHAAARPPSGPLSSAAALLHAAFLLLEASWPDLPLEGRLKSSEGL